MGCGGPQGTGGAVLSLAGSAGPQGIPGLPGPPMFIAGSGGLQSNRPSAVGVHQGGGAQRGSELPAQSGGGAQVTLPLSSLRSQPGGGGGAHG